MSPPCLPNGANVLNGDGGFGKGTGVVRSTNYNKPLPDNFDNVDEGGVENLFRANLCGFAGQDVTYIGTHFFNTPSVIEAASTIPGFHNNIAETVEEAVLFYTTDPFNNSIGGAGRAFLLGDQLTAGNVNSVMVQQIAAFLRAINALDSQSAAVAHLGAAITTLGKQKVRNILLAIRKIEDAIGVLTQGGASTANRLGGPMNLFTSDVISNFTAAKNRLVVIGKSDNALNSLKPTDLIAAQTALVTARSGMLQGSQ